MNSPDFGATVSGAVLLPFRPNRVRAWLAIIALLLGLVVFLLFLGSAMYSFYLLTRNFERYVEMQLLLPVFMKMEVLLFLACVILIPVWATSLGSRSQRYLPQPATKAGLLGWGWFIPGMNLVYPFRMLRQIWDGLHVHLPMHPPKRPIAMIVWQISFLLMNVFLVLLLVFSLTHSRNSMSLLRVICGWLFFLSFILSSFVGILAIFQFLQLEIRLQRYRKASITH